MPDRHTAWGASGWGCNAREPWAPPLFTAEPTTWTTADATAAERGQAGRVALVVVAALTLLLAGTAYVYAALHLL
ncbi:hypothetical protein GCM10023215_49210 [Pseudonocardia yuanmonensis]|uniref:Uncharacterized protein n=1 Tax=Pseudonocardia yuanmonensis TaxID=1095914 RepID=A0ABP8XC22_9PSEU